MILTTGGYHPRHYYAAPWVTTTPRRNHHFRVRREPVETEFGPALQFFKLIAEGLHEEDEDNNNNNNNNKNTEKQTETKKTPDETKKTEEDTKSLSEETTKMTNTTQQKPKAVQQEAQNNKVQPRENKIMFQNPMVHFDEDEEKAVLSLDVPGFELSGLEILLDEDHLKVSGKRTNPWGDSFVFLRKFRVDPTVVKRDANGEACVTAELSLGVLSITVHKCKPQPKTRMIEITVQKPPKTTEGENDKVETDETTEATEATSTNLEEAEPESTTIDVKIETVVNEDDDGDVEVEEKKEAKATTKTQSDGWEDVASA